MANTKEKDKNSRVFDVEVEKGKKQTFRLREISAADQRAAQKVFNQAFNDAVESNAPFKKQIDEILKKKGLWDDAKQGKVTEKQGEIRTLEKKLAEGGMPLSSAKQIAIDIRKLRGEIATLISPRTDYLSTTAEGQADNARFNYFVANCLVYNDTGKPYFTGGLDEYLNKPNDPVGFAAAQTLASIQYELDPSFENNLPENKFLREFGFTNEKGWLVREDGKLVDLEGKLINEEGFFVNEAGERVNKDGERIDDDGNLIVERKPFLNDDGTEAKPKVDLKKDQEEAKPEEQAKDSGTTG